jgi:hypothetical protein
MCETHYIDTINEWCRLIQINEEDDKIKFLPASPLEERPKTSIGIRLLDRLHSELNELVLINLGDCMPMGLIISFAMIGLASSYAERDAKFCEGLTLIKKAELLADRLDDKYINYKIEFKAARLDCRGWILYKQDLLCDKEDQITESIRCLEDSISTEASCSAYLHLAMAYELSLKRLDNSKDDLANSMSHAQKSRAPNGPSENGEKLKSRLKERANVCCKHAKELDVKCEFMKEIADLEKSLNLVGKEEKPEDQDSSLTILKIDTQGTISCKEPSKEIDSIEDYGYC